MTDEGSGWFAYSPADPASLERLTAEQRALVEAHGRERAQPRPVGEVHVVFQGSGPGQAEVRCCGPDGLPEAELLRAAVRELQFALTVFRE